MTFMFPGDVVAQRFKIEHVAGKGGMGTVYRAHDLELGRWVALKILQGGQGVEERARFVREARVLSRIEHPWIVRHVAHGLTPNDEPYLVMDWLEGEDLAARLARERPSLEQSLTIVERAAEALAAAHALGVIHRDVKPSNLFLVAGEPEGLRVIDFGIARASDVTVRLTGTGNVLGTPAYMAPEQARGEGVLDAAVDVFALGAVLFECIAGEPPFRGAHVLAVLAKILFEDAPRLREAGFEVPTAVDELVARMLAKDKGARPADGKAVAAEIARLRKSARSTHPPTMPPSLTHREQRLVTVILADMPIREDSEDLGNARTESAAGIDATLARIRSSLAHLDAHVERLRHGPVIVALAGRRSAADQAEAAARCAFVLREATRDAGLFVATGLGEIGGRLPIGEVIERAIALGTTGARVPGKIRVDEVTARLLEGRFVIARHGDSLELEGERDAANDTARKLLGKMTPFVGRDREMAAIEATLAECVADSVARVVLVTGVPGIGKSRIRRELIERLRRGRESMEVWVAASDAMRASTPFGLAARILSAAAEVHPGEQVDVRRARLLERVGRVVAGAEADRIAAFLGEIADCSFSDEDRPALAAARRDPALMGEQIRGSWEAFFTAECAAHPVVVALEDLQWADAATVGLLDAALRSQREQPLLVLGFARPEVHERFPGLFAARGVQELRLGELSRKASERLVRGVLGACVRDEIVERVVRRASGHAFCLEELIRAEAEGRGEDPPGTALAMVQARIAALPPEARRAIRAASVFGETFYEGGVCALLGASDRDWEVKAAFEELVGAELVTPRAWGRFPGTREFVFGHALVRDAAHEMLTAEDRALAHRLAGEWLEQAGEDDPTILAEHFERGGDPSRAAVFRVRAMERAIDANQCDVALAHGARAEANGAQGTLLGEIRAMQGYVYNHSGEWGDMERCFRDAHSLLPPEHPRWLRSAAVLATLSGLRGDEAPLAALAEEIGRSGARYTAEAQLVALARLAGDMMAQGRYRTASPILHVLFVETSRGAAHLPLVVADVMAVRGVCAMIEGDWVGACEAFEGSIRAFVQCRAQARAIKYKHYLALAYLGKGLGESAEAVMREAMGESDRLGLVRLRVWGQLFLGLVHLWRGEDDLANAMARSVLASPVARSDWLLEGEARALLARIFLRRRELDLAEAEARRALEVATAPAFRCTALSLLAEVCLTQGRAEEARAAMEEASRILADTGGLTDGEAHVRRFVAEVERATGTIEDARKAALASRDWVMSRADRFADPAARRRFLDIPDHVRILELAEVLAGC